MSESDKRQYEILFQFMLRYEVNFRPESEDHFHHIACFTQTENSKKI